MPEPGKAKGARKGKAIHVALEALGEDGLTKVHQEATIIVSSIIDSNKQIYEAGSYEYAFRICYVIKKETVKDDGSTVTSFNWNEDVAAFTTAQRNPPFCRRYDSN